MLVTAPVGTDLAAVASALAGAVTGEGAGRDTGGAAVVLYAGAERLDPRRAVLGEPPLVDGAVLALGAPLAAEPHPELDDAPTQLHVVAGPDAGGVHLLHGGRITVGRSADADVPLDDPDVSRLHCAVTVGADGRVSVADLGSTNGTTLDGTRIGERAVRVPAGGLLRVGESALRLAPGGPRTRVPVVADGEGCLRVGPGADAPDAGFPPAAPGGTWTGPADAPRPSGEGTGHAYGSASWGAADAGLTGRDGDTHAGRFGVGDGAQSVRRRGLGAWARRLAGGRGEQQADGAPGYGEAASAGGAPDAGVPRRPDTWPDPAALLLTALGPGPRLWERGPGHPEALALRLGTADRSAPDGTGLLPAVPVTAALREAGALGLAGPRPRLSGLARAVLAQLAALHSPDLLEIVLISADGSRPVEERAAEWSWLGWLPHVRPNHGQDCRLLLAYDREQAAARTEELLRRVDDLTARGTGIAGARSIPAQNTGGSGARSYPRPYDTPLIPHQSQAPGTPGTPAGPLGAPASGTLSPAFGTAPRSPRRPSWAKDEADLGGTGFPGPYTVVVVDGDPGGTGLQEALARLAAVGPRAGVHVLCLAEVSASSASSPVARTYDTACTVTPTLRHCGAVALLSGDVAGTLQLMRVAPGGPVTPGVLATVDAVSPAWAERFARALAPLRPDGPAGAGHARVAAPLPQSARLLDELGLARATPASLMARWADAADDPEALGGRARAVLGAGPHGPVTADLVADGPHLLIEGPAGSGRTELLRAVVASLAAAERPDRLGMVLIDGRDGVGTGNGRNEGLRVCVEIPHVTTHLIANDPVRMREFAQSLSAELKRRAELLGRTDFAQWHAGRVAPGRVITQRTPPSAGETSASRSSTTTTSRGNGGTASAR